MPSQVIKIFVPAVSRNGQHKDVSTRTIGSSTPRSLALFEPKNCLKVHNAHFKLAVLIWDKITDR